MRHDLISVVEAAYEIELDTRAWLSQLLDRAAPRLDRGLGLAATIYRLDHGPDEPTVVSRAMDERILNALLVASRGDNDSHRIVGKAGLAFGTTTQRLQRLGFTESEARSHKNLVTLFYPLRVRDVLAVSVSQPTGRAVLIVAPMPDSERPPPAEAAVWNRVVAHIGAGARLRASSGEETDGGLSAGAEAVLSPSGALCHAEAAAQSRRAREALRLAARAMDRARGKERADANHALDLWQGLVAGRWSLVDRFDTDGRRFLVARRNDPDVRDPRSLSRRERQVLSYLALGHSLKSIAYSFGLSVSTIALHRKNALRKLGLRSPAEVARFFASGLHDEA